MNKNNANPFITMGYMEAVGTLLSGELEREVDR